MRARPSVKVRARVRVRMTVTDGVGEKLGDVGKVNPNGCEGVEELLHDDGDT